MDEDIRSMTERSVAVPALVGHDPSHSAVQSVRGMRWQQTVAKSGVLSPLFGLTV